MSFDAADHAKYGPGVARVLEEEAPAIFGWCLAKSVTGVEPKRPTAAYGRAPDQVEEGLADAGLRSVVGGRK